MAAVPRRRRGVGGVTFPLLLIGLGVVLLLRNAGLLPPRFWSTVGQLWPALLVMLGLELLIGARVSRPALTALLAGVLFLGIAGALVSNLVRSFTAPAASVASSAFEQTLDGASRATVHLHLGAGKAEVGALPSGAGQLAAGQIDRPAGGFDHRYRVRDGSGDLTLGLRGDGHWMPFFDGRAQPVEVGVQLNPDLPLTLETNLGASDARLDLSSLKVARLDLETGASNVWLRLPEAAGATGGRVRSGAAAVTIEVPPGVAAQISYQGGVSTIDVDQARFPLISERGAGRPRTPPPALKPPAPPKAAEAGPPAAPTPPTAPEPPAPPTFLGGSRVYRSPDYDTAANKIDLTIESGASTITIR